MKAELIERYGTDLTAVNAARVSMDKESDWDYYDEDGRGPVTSPSLDGEYFNIAILNDADKKLIHYLAKNKHTSCFEHQGATFRLKVPIFIARQIQRHRTFAYNEVSRRYVDTPPEFFYPEVLRARAANVKQGSADTPAKTSVDLQHYVGVAVGAYEVMIEDGVAPELARMILPQNAFTEFYMTGSLRNWIHFLKLRLDEHAQVEVRQIAQPIHDELSRLFPVSVEALMKYD